MKLPFFFTHTHHLPLLTLTLLSSHSSSARTIRTVSRLFLPLTRIVSPRKSCSFSMVAVDMDSTELSSLVASSTMSLLGADLRRRMAVAGSAFSSTCGSLSDERRERGKERDCERGK